MSEEAISFPRGRPKFTKPEKEEDFVRSSSNAEESTSKVKRVKEADLFSSKSKKETQSTSDKKSKSKKSKSKKKEEKESDSDSDLDMTAAEAAALKGIAVAPPKFVDLLRYSHVEKGMQFLGAVKELADLYATVSLPNGLKGRLTFTEISDTLTTMISKQLSTDEPSDDEDDAMEVDDDFEKSTNNNLNNSIPKSISQILKVGQILRVASLTTRDDAIKNKQLELSTRESVLNEELSSSNFKKGLVLAASIKSVEDHGYTVSIGLSQYNSFLPFKNVPQGVTFAVGQSVELAIESFNSKTSALVLTYLGPNSHMIPTKPDQVVTVDSLRPGMLVNAKVFKTLPNGLWLNFLDYFSGSVDIFHVQIQKKKEQDSDDEESDSESEESQEDQSNLIFTGEDHLKKHFREGKEVMARIIYIHPETKRISLSMLSHIVKMKPLTFDLTLGQKIENGVIKRVDEKMGIAMLIPSTNNPETKHYRGYVPLSKVSDKPKERLTTSHYEIDTTKKVRILALSYLDGVVTLTHRKTDWMDPFLRYEDVKPGVLVECTILSVNSKGATVKLSSTVEAFCPRTHMSDVQVSDPEARFKVGSKVKSRVLRVVPEKRQAFVTFKKTLVKSDLEIISDYKVASGTWGHGTISKIKPNGCVVALYGSVRGFVPFYELGIAIDSNANEDEISSKINQSFQVGQTIKCRVVDTNPVTEKMGLSFSKTVSATQAEKEQYKKYIAEFSVGTKLNATVLKRDEQGVHLQQEASYEGKTIKVPLIIPFAHLSDHKDLCKALLDSYKVGATVENLFIIAKRRGALVATCKTSLINAHNANNLPASFEELNEGSVYSGYITKVADFGLLVKFMGELCGLVIRSQVANNLHISNLNGPFYEGQSVRAMVSHKDNSKMQVLLTLKHAQCSTVDASWLHSYLIDQSKLKKKSLDVKKFKTGAIVTAKVTRSESYGVFMEVEGGLSGFVHFAQTNGGIPAHPVGSSCEALILDINYQKGIADLSLKPELISQSKKSSKSSKSSQSKSKPGETISATIELVKKDYLVLSGLEKVSGTIFYAPTKDFNNAVYFDPFAHFKPAQVIKVVVDSLSFESVPLATILSNASSTNSGATEKRQISFESDKIHSIKDVQIGETLPGQILSIHESVMEIALSKTVKGTIHITQVDNIKVPQNANLSLLSKGSEDSGSKKSSKKSSQQDLAKQLSELKLSKQSPFAQFKVGQVLPKLRVLGVSQRMEDGRYVQVTKIKNEQGKFKVDLSMRAENEFVPDWHSLKKGQIVPCWIHEVSKASIAGFISPSMRAYVAALDASADMNVVEDITQHFKVGQVVLGAVLDFDIEKQKVFLSFRAVQVEKGVATSEENAKVGDLTFGKILGFKLNKGLTMQLFGKTFAHVGITDLSDVYHENPAQVWTAMEKKLVECRIVALGQKSEDSGTVYHRVSLRQSKVHPELPVPADANPEINSLKDLSPGMKISGYISKIVPEKKFAFVQLGHGIIAHLPFAFIGDKYIEHPEKKYPVGTLVSGKITKVDLEKKQVNFAMREASGGKGNQVQYEDLKVGMKVRGVVGVIQSFGVFVKIKNSKISALCHVSEINDPEESDDKKEGKKKEEDRMTLEEIQELFKVGDEVRAVVIKKDDEKKKISLSMRPSRLAEAQGESDESEDEQDMENDESDSNSDDSGMQSVSSSDSDNAISQALQKKKQSKKRSASSMLNQDDAETQSDSDDSMDVDHSSSKKKANSPTKKRKVDEDSDSDEEHAHMYPGEDSDEDSEDEGSNDDSDNEVSGESDNDDSDDEQGDDDEEDEEDEEDDDDDEHGNSKLTANVEWDDIKFKGKNQPTKAHKQAQETWDLESESEDEAEVEAKPAQKKSNKKEKGKSPMTLQDEIAQEAEVMARERSLLDAERGMENQADFERALLANPNNSYVWVQFMAFMIHQGDLPKTREIAERALKRIDDREDNERFNVWVAYLKFENQYGTRESFSLLLKRAAQSHKAKPIYQEAIKMLIKSDRTKEAEDIYQTILKKYKHCMSSWVNWATYQFDQGNSEQARDILNRSLKSLVPRKHLALLNKFAQLEFKYGDAERGRTIFETVLGNHPKRTDIWFVYTDMEMKYSGDLQRVRDIFERLIALDLNVVKMKPVFKKYLTFESQHGTPETVQHVKQKAAEYIERKTSE